MFVSPPIESLIPTIVNLLTRLTRPWWQSQVSAQHIHASITCPNVPHRVLVAKVIEIIDQIEALARTLPKSVPKAERNGKIWRVLNKVNSMDTGTHAKSSTFIHRMNILFSSAACDPDGRMTQIRRGPLGILLLIQYLRKINWKSDGIPLAVATLKLSQLSEEMQHLWCVIFLSITDVH